MRFGYLSLFLSFSSHRRCALLLAESDDIVTLLTVVDFSSLRFFLRFVRGMNVFVDRINILIKSGWEVPLVRYEYMAFSSHTFIQSGR